MKVLLIQPADVLGSKYYEPPLSLMYLVASLLQQGTDTHMRDIRICSENFGLQRIQLGDFYPKLSSIQTDCLNARKIDEILAVTEKQFIDPTWKMVYSL